MANRLAQAGIPLAYAISVDQEARCSCRDSGLLPSMSGDRRFRSFVAQRFRPKSVSYTDADRFSDTGIQPCPQPDSVCDTKGSDADQSQSNTGRNSNSDRDSNPNATGLSQPECHTHAFACVTLAFFTVLLFLKSIEPCRQQKQNPQHAPRVLANC